MCESVSESGVTSQSDLLIVTTFQFLCNRKLLKRGHHRGCRLGWQLMFQIVHLFFLSLSLSPTFPLIIIPSSLFFSLYLLHPLIWLSHFPFPTQPNFLPMSKLCCLYALKRNQLSFLWSVYKISVIYTYLGTNCKWEYDYQTWYVPYTMKKQEDNAFQTFLRSQTSSADKPPAVRWGIYDFTACSYCNLGSVCPLWNKASIPW